jgi:N-methylhydantoinase A
VISIRLVIAGQTSKPEFPKREMHSGEAAPQQSIRVFLDGEFREIGLYQRSALLSGQAFEGPAVVAQEDCTTVVPPGFSALVDEFGNLRISMGATQ